MNSPALLLPVAPTAGISGGAPGLVAPAGRAGEAPGAEGVEGPRVGSSEVPELDDIPLEDSTDLLHELKAEGGASDETRARLESLLALLDPNGRMGEARVATPSALQEVAVATAQSPLLHPDAAGLGLAPRRVAPLGAASPLGFTDANGAPAVLAHADAILPGASPRPASSLELPVGVDSIQAWSASALATGEVSRASASPALPPSGAVALPSAETPALVPPLGESTVFAGASVSAQSVEIPSFANTSPAGLEPSASVPAAFSGRSEGAVRAEATVRVTPETRGPAQPGNVPSTQGTSAPVGPAYRFAQASLAQTSPAQTAPALAAAVQNAPAQPAFVQAVSAQSAYASLPSTHAFPGQARAAQAPGPQVSASSPSLASSAPMPAVVRAHGGQVQVSVGAAAASAGPAGATAGGMVGTFDSAPWLLPASSESASLHGGAERSQPSLQTVRTAVPRGMSSATRPGAMLLSPASTLPAGAVDAAASQGGAGGVSELGQPAQSSAQVARAPVMVAHVPTTVAPELPIMPHERPLTRLDVRVADGERMLRVGVVHESEGYAVEVRAPRDVVAEIQDMEADVDAALREDGGDGLTSFDASAEDGYDSPDSEAADAVQAPDPAERSSRPVDPNRLLDRHA